MEGDLTSIDNICEILDNVAVKSDELKKHDGFYFGEDDSDESRKKRLMRSLRRFMVTGKSYPWEEDACFKSMKKQTRPKFGGHPLLRSDKETEVFQALPTEIAEVLTENRCTMLSRSLPTPIFTEPIFQLYNSCHSATAEDSQIYESSIRPPVSEGLPIVANLLLSYLRRELVILGLEDARYVRFKPKKDPTSCYKRDSSFQFLSGEQIPTLDILHRSDKELKVRSLLACFDAELLMYIDADFHELPCFWSIFLACLRYLWVNAGLKDWEVNAFVAQFALSGLFTASDKNFSRLKGIFKGGDPECPEELPACERSLILANQFVAVYYAISRAQAITGTPFRRSTDDPGPCLLDIFSGSLFTILYDLFKNDPNIGESTRLTARIIDDKWIGMHEDNDNDEELDCYENAIKNYFDVMKFYISPLRNFDRRVAEKGLEFALEENISKSIF